MSLIFGSVFIIFCGESTLIQFDLCASTSVSVSNLVFQHRPDSKSEDNKIV